MRPTLLLPAPVYRACVRCGINTGTVAEYADEMEGVYFIERRTRLGNAWDVCSLCEPEYQVESARARITFSRGVPPWCGEEHAFFGFEDMPMLCVAPDDSADGWVHAEPQIGEVWLFCRNRQEFRSAWQIARTIVRSGRWPVEEYGPIWLFLPAYKPAGAFSLLYTTDILNRRAADAGPKVGQCDRCMTDWVLVKARPGSQWCECEDCHDADVARLAGEEAGV